MVTAADLKNSDEDDNEKIHKKVLCAVQMHQQALKSVLNQDPDFRTILSAGYFKINVLS